MMKFMRLSCSGLLVLTVTLLFLQTSGHAATALSPRMERYYRAVCLLQEMGGPAAAEPVAVPRKILFRDATESLRHHPDKIFVLHTIANDLHSLGTSPPEAPLFEAYARLALGERVQAANLLYAYVSVAPYQRRHYTLLTSLLHEQAEPTSLYLVCREWEKLDPVCNTERSRLTWSALYAMGRHADALATALASTECLGWRAYLYAARAALAAGDAHEAKALVRQAEEMAQPDKSPEAVQALWDEMRSVDVF